MKKVILIACVAALLVAMVAASASASSTNWVVLIKAYSPTWGVADKSSDIGLNATASSTKISTLPVAGKAEAVIDGGDGSFYSKYRVAEGPTAENPVTWNLKAGLGSAAFNSVKIAIFNQAKDFLGADQALDTSLYYQFKNGSDVIASFATADVNTAMGGLTNWVDISQIMQAAGWSPTSTATGWYYEDTTPTTNAAWTGLESYSFTANAVNTPEPGSLLALGSGLLGFAGYAIRRRRA